MSITLYPPTTPLSVGSDFRLNVVLRDVAGNWLPNRTVSFTSSNESVATVDAAGMVRALAEGEASITATCEGKSTRITIVVMLEVPSGGSWDPY